MLKAPWCVSIGGFFNGLSEFANEGKKNGSRGIFSSFLVLLVYGYS